MSLLRIVLLATVALAAGCQGFTAKDLHYDDRTRIVTIAVEPIWVPGAQATMVAKPGAQFGLIGALADSSWQAEATGELQGILSTMGYDYGSALVGGVHLAVDRAGFLASPVEGTRPTKFSRAFLEPPPRRNDVDAVLDVNIPSLGFFAKGAVDPYMPGCHIRVRLVDAKTGAILMQKQIIHGRVAPASGPAIIQRADPANFFENRDALKADYSRTTAALRQAIEGVLLALEEVLAGPKPKVLPGEISEPATPAT